jgi:hypothetical protein
MYGELGAVRGIVDLSPEYALDEAEAFLASQSYSILRRTSTTLTAERLSSEESAGEGVPNLTVAVMPQPEGGVQIKIRGNDFEGVQARQTEWIGWSESLPRKAEGEAGAPSDEQGGIQTPEVELPPPPTVESHTPRAPTPEPSVQPLPPQQPQQTRGWSAGRILLLVIVAPVLLAVAWIVFQFSVGFLNGLLGG